MVPVRAAVQQAVRNSRSAMRWSRGSDTNPVDHAHALNATAAIAGTDRADAFS